MKDLKFRNEIKHYINISDYFSIRSRLMQIMRIDKNSNADREYRIRSLYFDNIRDKVLMEKINGINKREKFRIRFYNDDHSFIRLEKKSKINGLCNKISESISKNECKRILNRDIDFLKVSNKGLFVELYSKMKWDLLRPKTIVDYTREAYVYPVGNVRITFDKNIRTGIHSKNLFDKDLPTINSVDNRYIVLEVKYDEFLPAIIQDIIQTNDRPAQSISKYAAARIYG
ncbi:polyphosphate polymerase domain-containing protein [Clostridium brassicae]|uniref:Polyphosphate polymerase domain-containing protein n=1 Tax=Clostridium brassicae TaxID=2999072 RepID=A0ABT4DC13_9CLOT|nr:polyphosphate polymerase domain-containing protein [Clostridium brassicae]MCY6959849.1 polyphosphate polymerase domain-containing protein [Clostridium brassicae]